MCCGTMTGDDLPPTLGIMETTTLSSDALRDEICAHPERGWTPVDEVWAIHCDQNWMFNVKMRLFVNPTTGATLPYVSSTPASPSIIATDRIQSSDSEAEIELNLRGGLVSAQILALPESPTLNYRFYYDHVHMPFGACASVDWDSYCYGLIHGINSPECAQFMHKTMWSNILAHFRQLTRPAKAVELSTEAALLKSLRRGIQLCNSNFINNGKKKSRVSSAELALVCIYGPDASQSLRIAAVTLGKFVVRLYRKNNLIELYSEENISEIDLRIQLDSHLYDTFCGTRNTNVKPNNTCNPYVTSEYINFETDAFLIILPVSILNLVGEETVANVVKSNKDSPQHALEELQNVAQINGCNEEVIAQVIYFKWCSFFFDTISRKGLPNHMEYSFNKKQKTEHDIC